MTTAVEQTENEVASIASNTVLQAEQVADMKVKIDAISDSIESITKNIEMLAQSAELMKNYDESAEKIMGELVEISLKISKSSKDLEVFFCPFLEESNFRNKQSMVQYPRSYQWDSWTIGKEQNTNHTQVSQTCISKTNLIFFYGRCRVVHHADFCRSDRGLLHHFRTQT